MIDRNLTTREREIVRHVSVGLTTMQIADRPGIGAHVVSRALPQIPGHTSSKAQTTSSTAARTAYARPSRRRSPNVELTTLFQ